MNRPRSISLRDRMLVASMLLAALVVGVFAALILAVSAARTATRQETHSKDVTTAALGLQRTLLEIETGARGYAIPAINAFSGPTTRRFTTSMVRARNSGRWLPTSPGSNTLQVRSLERSRGTSRDFANPVVQVFSNRRAATLAAQNTGRQSDRRHQAELRAVSHS